MPDHPEGPHVYIVGAGIAGMVAALRLLESHRRVTVFEASGDIGGKFGAEKDRHGIYHEHAFHIFADWCLNFFKLCRDIGLRPDDFVGFPHFHVLRPAPTWDKKAYRPKGRPLGDLLTLDHLGSPDFFWKNVNSGVAAWDDMVLFGYSYLDLLTDQRFEREEFLNRVSVNGYVRSLPYASDMAGLLHQDLLLKVFASPSYEVSARTYQTYLKLTTAVPGSPPPFRSLKGNCRRLFWERFEKTLPHEEKGTYRLLPNRRLEKIEMDGNRIAKLIFKDEESKDEELKKECSQNVGPEEHVIIAIPPEQLSKVVQKSPDLIKIAPQLLEVGQLRAVRFAALDLYFTTQLTLPKAAHVTLMDDPAKLLRVGSQEAKNGIASEYGLSFIDNGSIWPGADWGQGLRGKHFLSVLVGDFGSLSELDTDTEITPEQLAGENNAPGLIIADLQKYLHFTADDVDWDRSYFRSQKDTPLFVNSVGSWEYRPETRLGPDDRKMRDFERIEAKIPNLHLAGDYCRSRIDVVSVEAAIVTGITAARAICDRVEKALDPFDVLPKIDMDRIDRAKRLLSGWKDIAAARARAKAAP